VTGSPRGDEPLDVLLLGPIAPALGGVASHLERLRVLLPAHGVRVGVLSHYRAPPAASDVVGSLNRNPLRYWLHLRRQRSRVVHYHHSHWALLAAVALAARGDRRRYVITVHGEDLRQALGASIPGVAPLTRWGIRQFDDVIAVSEGVADGLRPYVAADRLIVVPAFLPPEAGEARRLDAGQDAFLAGGRPVIVVSCTQLCSGQPASDAYGLDLAVEAFCRLAPRHPGMRLALFLGRPPSSPGQRRYVRDLERRVRAEALGERLLLAERAPLLPAFRHDVVYLRPSRTDGDAVSIREALSLGVPVLASDVVPRPPGTVTFPTADVESLGAALEALLEPGRRDRPTADGRTGPEPGRFLQSLLSVYGAPHSERRDGDRV
jgi:glycogen synthase